MKYDLNKRADTRKPGFEPAKPGQPMGCDTGNSFIRDRKENGYVAGKGNAQQQDSE